MGIILLVVLLLLIFGALPNGPVPISNEWGYGPSGILGILLLVVLILVILGRL